LNDFSSLNESRGKVTTSKNETKEAAIIAKASPALNVGGPHWKKPGKYTLRINAKL